MDNELGVDAVLAEINAGIKRLNGQDPADTDQLPRRGSRFVGPHTAPSLIAHVAAGGSYSVEEPRALSLSQRGGGIASVMTKALAEGTSSAGGYLVPVETAEEVLKQVRARSAVMRLGPRIVAVKKQLNVVSIASGATAYYVAENAQIPVSEETFAEAPLLMPKELAALVPVSNRLLRDAAESPDLDQLIRDDLGEVLALRADLAFLRGAGSGGEPRGLLNQPGLTDPPDLGANGSAIGFDHLKDAVANLRARNAPFLRPGWVFSPQVLASLEKLKAGDDRYLADPTLLTFNATGGGGTLLGFPFVTSTQIPTGLTVGTSDDCTEIYLSSDWQEFWLGEEQALTIEVSAEAAYDAGGGVWTSAFQNRQHLFRAVITHDCAPRRPEFFSVMTGVRP